MNDRGFAILRQLMSDVEGAPSPGVGRWRPWSPKV